MAFLETEGGRVYYEDHPGDKRAIVFVHGWAMAGECWNSAIEAVCAAGHRAIVVDHRGCGRSDRDFADMSIDAIARDVAAIVRKCGADSVVLNGWSLGGAVVVAAANDLDGKVAGLVLTCAASPRYVKGDDFPHGGTPDDVAAIPAAIAGNRAGFFRALAAGACAEGTDQATIDWLERMFLASGPRCTDSLLGLVSLDQRETLAAFDFPVLSIGGARDAVADPAIAGYAARCARDGDLKVFEQCGHTPHLEAPAEYNDAILAFLGKLT